MNTKLSFVTDSTGLKRKPIKAIRFPSTCSDDRDYLSCEFVSCNHAL